MQPGTAKSWDPGIPRTWESGGKSQHIPNGHLQAIIVSTTDMSDDMEDGSESRTELDMHANMCVVGKHCFIIRWTGQKAEVNPFTPDYEAL